MISIPIVRVGNSRGIRFPKNILEALGSPTEVMIDVQNGSLTIHPVISPRKDWESGVRWKKSKLTAEDVQWLEADPIDDADRP